MAFSGEVEIDVGLPGQDCPLVTLEIVRPHVRMQVAPVAITNDRVVAVVVATFVGGIAMMPDGSDV